MGAEALDIEVKRVIQNEIKSVSAAFINQLRDAGLVLVPTHAAVHAIEFEQKRQKLLRKTKVTVYEADKYKLFDRGYSMRTIKKMFKDGRIMDHEHYTNDKGKHYLMVSAIKRLNEDE